MELFVNVEDVSVPVSDEMSRAFFDGAVRKELGLGLGDLKLGLDVAKNCFKRGAHAEAMRLYIALVLCDPSDVDYQVGLSNCALHLGEFDLALQAASAAIALSPRDPRGYYLSGRACMGLGKPSEAIEDLVDAVKFAKTSDDDESIVEEAAALLRKLAHFHS